MPRTLGVIPARFDSQRFPGKPLAALGERTMIEEVWRRARQASSLDRLVVATDDRRIADAADGFGAEVMLTERSHPSGSDRVAEVARRLGSDYAIVLNVQGDEPLLTPTSLDRLVDGLARDEAAEMATLVEPIVRGEDLFDPNVVKLVRRSDGRILYFSRAPIPFYRAPGGRIENDPREALARRPGGLAGYLKHQGLYAFRRDALLALTAMSPSPLELDEGLEQLRALEAGYRIRAVESDFRSLGVDTPADLDRVARILVHDRE